MKSRSAEAHVTPAALVSHTIVRVQGEQNGDIAVNHACSPNARLRLQWGGLLMTMLSAQAVQGVLEGFCAARSAMTLIPRQIPAPAPATAEPFALPTVAIDWMRRPAYAVVPRQELSRDRARQLRWLDLHMGPVTFQILDQAGGISAVELLTTAHRTGVQVFLDGPDFAADPRERDYAPPNG
ncbi:hypothetical protein MGALJ_61850 (plasmid) [Mycobacterium gallinarum]|uniref:Uncharacterized protein n=1 Tax=Mycobacterium gallinarum TaxID=39689 RepID=A0A9W4B9H0_9MYCO|nr:hypothetical protein [Mycobacterium gallinarum]BBY96516.1 hypothetical protein MGALJ_61850 [Mycobacterium gallinarum]